MESLIPLNGRIAIVDDDEKQAMPLMRVFSRNNIPYTFYKGNDYRFLPETPENDIRILFLDLNLLGNTEENPKDIRSVLIPTLSHILSPHNYPYILILWSRQESLYLKTLEDVFKNELKDCSPIAIKNYVKSDFFHDYGTEEDDTQDDLLIINELKRILSELPAYSYLMQWENCIHNAADKTIQDIFHDFHSPDKWNNSANCILDMFSKSYLEKHFGEATNEEKVRASLFFLNDVYYDTMESTITNSNIENPVEFLYETNSDLVSDIKSKVNSFLLISKSQTQISQPGCIVISSDNIAEHVKCAKSVLDDCLDTEYLRKDVIKQFGDIKNKEAKKLYDQKRKELREAILLTAIPCGVVVTPVCDYAQKKVKYDRIVLGLIIDSCNKQFIDAKSEAIYVSPSFDESAHERVLVLNYRFFLTQELRKVNDIKVLFRIRNSVLSEIQSKLARHINRQGIMNL